MGHTSPAAFIARVVESTTRTTTGTQNVTFSGIGTVKGFYILAARVSAEDTLTQGYSVCQGFGDNSSRQRCVSTWGEDAAATTDCGTQGTRNFCLRLLDPTSGAPLVEASYVGNVHDGIQLSYTTVEGTAWKFTCVLFAGQQSSCFVGDEEPNTVGGAAKTVTTGIAQDFCIAATMPTVSETTSYDHAVYIAGIATRSGDENFCNGMIAHDGEAQGRSRRLSRNDTCGYNVTISGASATAVVGTAITNHTATGFDVSSVGTAGNTGLRIAFIAVQAGDATAVGVESTGFTTPTSTGNVSAPGVGHPTGFLLLTYSTAATQNSAATQGAAGIGVWDGRTEVSVCIMDEDGAAPSNTGMIYRNRIIDLYSHAQAELVEAVTVSQDASGFTLNYTTVSATARRASRLSVEEMPLLMHVEETVSIADAQVFSKSALITQETVSISEGQFFVVSATKQDETVQIGDQVKFVGVASLVTSEGVSISDSMLRYPGGVLVAPSETVLISDAFASAGVTRMRSKFFAGSAIGGPEAGRCDMGGAKKAEVS